MINRIRHLLGLAPRPLLTDDERAHEFNRLSIDDCGHIVAHVASQHPAVFDTSLAALARYRTGLEA